MSRKHYIAAVLLLAFLSSSSCLFGQARKPDSAFAARADTARDLGALLGLGGAELLRDPLRIVARDSAVWHMIWPLLTNQWKEPPNVDFSRDMLIIAGMGRRATGGYYIRIDTLPGRSNYLRVRVVQHVPGPRCGLLFTVTSPIAMLRVPQTPRAVRMEEVLRVEEC